MFVTKKRFDQMKKAGDDFLAQRAENALRDAETIGRLQRENARLLGELAPLKAEREKRLAILSSANAARAAKAKAKKVVA